MEPSRAGYCAPARGATESISSHPGSCLGMYLFRMFILAQVSLARAQGSPHQEARPIVSVTYRTTLVADSRLKYCALLRAPH